MKKHRALYIVLIACLIFLVKVSVVSAAFSSIGTIGTAVTATGDPLVFTVDAGGAAEGNLVVIGVATNSANASTGMTDSKGNTYRLLRTVSRTGLSVDLYGSTLTTALVSGDTISADFAASQTASMGGWEWSGIYGDPVVDVSNTGNNGTDIDVPPTASITTRVNSDLVVTITAISAAASCTLDHNPPTNYTAGLAQTTGSPEFYMPYSIVSGKATRAWDGNQWNKTGNVATVNVAIELGDIPTRKLRLLGGYRINFISGRIILNQD